MQTTEFDIRAARERLGLTTESVAAALQVTEGEVIAWEKGSIRVPRRARRLTDYLVAQAEWDAGMTASGLPECGWLNERIEALSVTASSARRTEVRKAIGAHVRGCEVCLARDGYARAHLPPPPRAPQGWLGSAFAAMNGFIDHRLPAWARPAAWGAVALSLMTSARILFFLPGMLRSPLKLLEAVGISLAAGAAGAAGGLTYAAIRPILRPLGTFGDYLTGILSVAGYLGSFAIGAALAGEPLIEDVPGLVIFLFCAVLFGLPVGKMISDGRETSPARA